MKNSPFFNQRQVTSTQMPCAPPTNEVFEKRKLVDITNRQIQDVVRITLPRLIDKVAAAYDGMLNREAIMIIVTNHVSDCQNIKPDGDYFLYWED